MRKRFINDPNEDLVEFHRRRVSQSGFDPVRTLLEDFEEIAGKALLSRGDAEELGPPLEAVVIARTLHLRSIDYALRRYVMPARGRRKQAAADKVIQAYVASYRSAKDYVFDRLNQLEPDGKRDPTVGEFGASVALERLPYSFFSAHLLYRLGHRYEGHAVSRHILEQLAWAYSASQLDDVDGIAKIVTTKTLTQLGRFFPDVGRLYGFLSKKTHVDYSSHFDFIRVVDGQNAILMAQPEHKEYATVLLQLADIFGAVWESSQFHFIVAPRAVHMRDNHLALDPDRGFLKIIGSLLEEIDRARHGESATGTG